MAFKGRNGSESSTAASRPVLRGRADTKRPQRRKPEITALLICVIACFALTALTASLTAGKRCEERRRGGEARRRPAAPQVVGERLRAGGRRERPVRAAVTQPGSGGHDSGVAKVTSRSPRLHSSRSRRRSPSGDFRSARARAAARQNPTAAHQGSRAYSSILARAAGRARPAAPRLAPRPPLPAPTNRRRGRDGGCRSGACALPFWPRPRKAEGSGRS